MTIRDASDAGTIALALKLPWPWPVEHAGSMIERELNGSVIQIASEPAGHVQASLVDRTGAHPEMNVISCPLVLTEPAFVFFAVVRERPNYMRIEVNDAIVASLSVPEEIPKTYEVPKRPERDPDNREDFSRDNATAVINRRGTLTGYQHNPRKIPGKRENLIKSLVDQSSEAQDLLKFIDGDALHHAPGLANSLNKLIVSGNPMPTLQMCAADKNASLILFTVGRPHVIVPLSPDASFYFDVSAEPTTICDNPIDLDVWLELPAASLGKKTFTHKQAISAIKNDVGSHADYDVDPLVGMLRSTKSAVVGGEKNDLSVQYIRNLAAVALKLSHDICSLN